MSLEQIINDDIKTAMKAKDAQRLASLRAVKSAIILAKTEKGGGSELSKEVEIAILQRLVKQRKDSAKLYQEQGREDLFKEEEAQLQVIEHYLPEQLGEDEIRAEIKKIIDQTNASSMKDMGMVMGMAGKVFSGKADNKTIATIVKELLS